VLFIDLAALNELKATIDRGGIKLADSILEGGVNQTGLGFLPLLLLVLVKDYLRGFPWQEGCGRISNRQSILV
jgi:hypothetical protein